ncbi:hypothetical protein ACFE04_023414 [Oxalis oulophora]
MTNNLERKDQEQTNEQQPPLMAASSIAVDGVAAATLRYVLLRVQKEAKHSGRSPQSIRVVAVSRPNMSPSSVKSTTPKKLLSFTYVETTAGVPNLVMVETVDDQKNLVKMEEENNSDVNNAKATKAEINPNTEKKPKAPATCGEKGKKEVKKETRFGLSHEN